MMKGSGEEGRWGYGRSMEAVVVDRIVMAA